MGIRRRKEVGLERRRAMVCRGRLEGDDKKLVELQSFVGERLGIPQ